MSKSRVLTAQKSMAELSLVSPWAFFSLSEGGVDGLGTSTVAANDSRATTLVDLPMNTAITNQWTAKNGWWTGDGVDSCFVQPWTSDTTALDQVFKINQGAMLIWGAVDITATATGRIFYMGQNKGSSPYLINGFEVIVETDKVKARFSSSGDTYVVATSNGTIADGTEHIFACLVDHRASVQQAIMYDNVAGAGTMTAGTAVSTSSEGAITGGVTNANKKLLIGASLNGSQSLSNFLGTIAAASVRRLGFINFGTSGPPANVSQIITDLEASGGIPVESMNGV